MNRLSFLILIIALSHCSFDNKTGIWKNSNESVLETNNKFKDFKTLYSSTKIFDQIIEPPNNLNLKLNVLKTNLEWLDEYYQNSNNLDNFSFSNLNKLIFKSKKLTRHNVKSNLLFDGNNAVITDEKGNIIVYSLDNQEIILRYNFYKKKYKRLRKKLSVVIEKNVIYVGDNLGYLYALNYISGKLLWAKNYKTPFRSNIKINEQNIIISDINNFLYFIKKSNGEQIKFIPTEKSTLKNNFINSLSSNDNSLFLLNTYGSLYSINKNGFINWFVNLNRSRNLDQINFFYANPLVLSNNKIIITSDPYLYILDIDNGSTLFKKPISSIVKPIVSGKNLFLITKKNLLICINIDTQKILYSIKISKEIAEFLNSKERPISIKSFAILNNSLFVFLNNSYFVNFNVSGKIENIDKLPSKISSFPIFINDSIMYLNKKNKLVIVN